MTSVPGRPMGLPDFDDDDDGEPEAVAVSLDAGTVRVTPSRSGHGPCCHLAHMARIRRNRCARFMAWRPGPSRLLSHCTSVVEMLWVTALACIGGGGVVLGLGLGGDAGADPFVSWLPFPSGVGRALGTVAGHASNVSAVLAGVVGITLLVAGMYRWAMRQALVVLVAMAAVTALGGLVAVAVRKVW
jgi:hypothetical protein